MQGVTGDSNTIIKRCFYKQNNEKEIKYIGINTAAAGVHPTDPIMLMVYVWLNDLLLAIIIHIQGLKLLD